MSTYTEQSDYVLESLEDRATKADSLLSITQSLIGDARNAITSAVEALSSLNVTPVEIEDVFEGTAPILGGPMNIDDLPTVGGADISEELDSINDTVPWQLTDNSGDALLPDYETYVAVNAQQWEQLFSRAIVEQTRVAAGQLNAAQRAAQFRGLALPSVAMEGGVAAISQNLLNKLSSTANEIAAEQIKAVREDSMKALEILAKNYKDRLDHQKHVETEIRARYETNRRIEEVNANNIAKQYSLELQAEQQHATAYTALGEVRLRALLDPLRVEAEYNLKKTELAVSNSIGELTNLIQVYAQLCNALFSASDTSLSSGVSLGIGYPFKYNPEAGDVVIDAL